MSRSAVSETLQASPSAPTTRPLSKSLELTFITILIVGLNFSQCQRVYIHLNNEQVYLMEWLVNVYSPLYPS